MDEEIIVINEARPPRGLGWRISLTIMLGIGWLAFVIIWLFFYAGNYDLYQNIAIIIVSILAGMGMAALIWVTFGLRMAREKAGADADVVMRSWISWRGIASMLIWVGWLVFVIVWLFYYAGSYNFYQNLAVAIVSLLIAGGLSWVVSASLWRR
jgi:hypothetical protein